jgi:beta-glucanase (GH16 family)
MTAPAGYVQVWGDEFDGAALDAAKWKATLPTEFSGYGAEHWDPALATVGNGQLGLYATSDLRAGEVRSLPSFTPPLYAECRMQLPSTPGFWPGFWMLSGVGTYQEIDVAECDSSEPRRIGMNLHWGVAGASPADNGGYTDPATDYQAGLHTFGVLYMSTAITFYVDDVMRRTWWQSVLPVFFDPMQLRFTLSIFGANQPAHTAPGAATAWPGKLAVDWVRVWQSGALPVVKPKHHGKP